MNTITLKMTDLSLTKVERIYTRFMSVRCGLARVGWLSFNSVAEELISPTNVGRIKSSFQSLPITTVEGLDKVKFLYNDVRGDFALTITLSEGCWAIELVQPAKIRYWFGW